MTYETKGFLTHRSVLWPTTTCMNDGFNRRNSNNLIRNAAGFFFSRLIVNNIHSVVSIKYNFGVRDVFCVFIY